MSRPNCKNSGCTNLARNKGHHPNGERRYGNDCHECHRKASTGPKKNIDNSQCAMCGWDKGPCDRHRIDPSKGYTASNVIPLCPNCHRIVTLREQANPETAMCLNAGAMKRNDAESETLIVQDVAHALRADGFDASEDGTGRGAPLVAVPILEAGARTGKSTDDPRAGIGIGEDGDPMFTLSASGGSSRSYVAQMAVRRLTPTECERLQGFPDGYTNVEFRGKPAADGPRYKSLGNSMAVPVMRWILERAAQVLEAK